MDKEWFSGRVPLAFREVATGMESLSANCLTSACAPERVTPPPATMTGRRLALNSSAARCRLPASGRGRMAGYRPNWGSKSGSRSASPSMACPKFPPISR